MLSQVQHYFIGTHSIFDHYSAGQYELDAIALLDRLFVKHPVVLLVGGSMMYIDAVCKGFDDIPSVDAQTRKKWQQIYAEKGLEYIQQELTRLDPEHTQVVDMQTTNGFFVPWKFEHNRKTTPELRIGKQKDRNFNIKNRIELDRERNCTNASING